MRCPNCQAECSDKAHFCPHCGTPVPESSTTQVHQQVGTVTDGGTVVGTIQAGEGSQVHIGDEQHYGDVVYGDKVEAPPIGIAALHQLPQPPRDFTGRDAELTELEAALTAGGATLANGCPLVGLRGMGGVGKTALALVLAHRLAPRYPDAQFFLDLRGTAPQPLTAAQAMAHVVRAYHPTARLPETEAELAPLYHSVLTGQRALLLMDNAADRAQVEPLLCPDACLLLVTSRQRFTLPGLHALDLDALPLADAEALLLRIAPRIDGHAPDMARLCGCLPLALRLAAGALAEREDLGVDEYLQRLQEGQAQRELVEASLRLSYDLLTAELQARWRTLALFPATFDRAAAAAVWAVEETPAHDALGELVRYSLLEWDGEARRYRLHDLARACAGAWLQAEEGEQARRRHARHYEQVLRDANELYLQGGEAQIRGLATFDLEQENVEAGQAWAATHAGVDRVAAQLCSKYAEVAVRILRLRLPPQEWIRWLEAATNAAQGMGDRRGKGIHLGNLGNAYRTLGQVADATQYYQQALDIARTSGDRRAEATHLGNLGRAYLDLEQGQKAIDHLREAVEIAKDMGDRRSQGIHLRNLGDAYRAVGYDKGAMDHYEQALNIAESENDHRGEGACLGSIGNIHLASGQHDKAIHHYRQALDIAQKVADRQNEGIWLGNLGLVYSNLGEVKHAIEYTEAALKVLEKIQSPHTERVREQLAQLR